MSAILTLEDGQIFHGQSCGVDGVVVGELVFNTAMTGYQEIITDPSYSRQIIVFTCPHIGNTGINFEDSQSDIVHASGLVFKSISKHYSNWRAKKNLQDLLVERNVVAINGVDTRGLTHKLRKHGALRACIMAGQIDSNKALRLAREFPGLSNLNLAKEVGVKQELVLNHDGKLSIVLMDFGVKQGIVDCLLQHDCKVTIVPWNTKAERIIALEPDGVLLSNGPGDPQACHEVVAQIKTIIKIGVPIFGICLGHQLLALALDAKTYKMNFGHHGANHPVQDLRTKQIMITSQNHGFAVLEESLKRDIEVTHRSLFDHSLQGFRHKQFAIFGFQGHPEADPGPRDAKFLFDEFFAAVKTVKSKVQYAEA